MPDIFPTDPHEGTPADDRADETDRTEAIPRTGGIERPEGNGRTEAIGKTETIEPGEAEPRCEGADPTQALDHTEALNRTEILHRTEALDRTEALRDSVAHARHSAPAASRAAFDDAAGLGYRIEESIGAGGMGIVRRAVDADGREVAIKFLRPEVAGDPRSRARLAREVHALQSVSDPHVAQVHDAELDSDSPFIVTAFVDGPTLEDAVAQNGPLHPEVVREIGAVLGDTLRSIHAAGLVHRDIKPGNVLIRGARREDLVEYDPDGEEIDPVLIDFGIAQAAEESRLTSTGLVMGTAAYLDPQFLTATELDDSIDWWAYAATLAYAATGHAPFGTGRADVVLARAMGGRIDLDGAPPGLAAWLRGMLAPDRKDRTPVDQALTELDGLDVYEAPAIEAETEAGTDAEAVAGQDSGVGASPDDVTERQSPIAPRGADDANGGRSGAEDDEVADPTEVIAPIPDADVTAVIQKIPPRPESPTRVLPAINAPIAQSPAQTPPRGPVQPQIQPQAQPQPGMPSQPYQAPPYPYMTQPDVAPRRSGIIVSGHILAIAAAAVAPVVTLIVVILLHTVSRTWEKSHAAFARRRGEFGARTGDTWAVGAAAPLRFLTSLIGSVLALVFPLIVGVLAAISADAVLYLASGSGLPDGAMCSLAMAVALLLTWYGIGGSTLRPGAHRFAAALGPSPGASRAVWIVLVLLIVVCLLAGLERSWSPDFLPLTGVPRISDIAVWRIDV